MANPLQEQLLKAGLVKKAKLAEVVREQTRQRHGKAPPAPSAEQLEAARVQAQRAERDRALAAERNAQRRAAEVQAQVRQIVDLADPQASLFIHSGGQSGHPLSPHHRDFSAAWARGDVDTLGRIAGEEHDPGGPAGEAPRAKARNAFPAELDKYGSLTSGGLSADHVKALVARIPPPTGDRAARFDHLVRATPEDFREVTEIEGVRERGDVQPHRHGAAHVGAQYVFHLRDDGAFDHIEEYLRIMPMRTGELGFAWLMRRSGSAGFAQSLVGLLARCLRRWPELGRHVAGRGNRADSNALCAVAQEENDPGLSGHA